MKRLATAVALAALASLSTFSLPAAAESAAVTGLAEIKELGRVNGQALACGEMATSSKAKALMIRHAPKTRGYGEQFEAATSAAFLAQGKGVEPCPQAADFTGKLAQLAERLQAALPAAQ